MKIAVIGTGYVGLVTGTCLADSGQEVTNIDLDENKIEMLHNNQVPIYEPGLEDVLVRNVEEKRQFFTTSLSEGMEGAEVVFIAVGTPSAEDGSPNMSYVYQAAEDIGSQLKGYAVVVIKSTVPVGTAAEVRKRVEKHYSGEFAVVSNPEFLKEGTAVDDFMRPDRVVVGTDDERAIDIMKDLYSPFVRTGNPIFFMDNQSAEITKYACNAYLATRISFINEISLLCEKAGADVNRVREGMGSDSRIGNRFLFPGVGYGGSCFPKDVRAIVHTGGDKGLEMKISKAALEVNQRQRIHFVDKIISHFGGDLSGKKVAVWGLSFKPKTDDIREAPALTIIEKLLEKGATVQAYDPEGMENTKKYFSSQEGITFTENNYQACEGADCLIVVTEWNEFRRPDLDKIKKLLASPLVFDGRNIYNGKKMVEKGFEYHCVGVGTGS